jgi:hypothetical protein
MGTTKIDTVLEKRICINCDKIFKVYRFIGKVPPPRKRREYPCKRVPRIPVEKPKRDLSHINTDGLLARAGRYKEMDREERKK